MIVAETPTQCATDIPNIVLLPFNSVYYTQTQQQKLSQDIRLEETSELKVEKINWTVTLGNGNSIKTGCENIQEHYTHTHCSLAYLHYIIFTMYKVSVICIKY